MHYQSRILIVDDDQIARENLRDLLLSEPYHLAFAPNGQEALAQMPIFDPDLVLLDVMMPGMDGFEVCRRLRANVATADVPIIMLTALDDRQSRLLGIECGADDFISKPYDRLELRTRLRTISRLNRYRRLLTERFKFELVVEHSHIGYVLLTDEDECVFANPQACRYLNLPDTGYHSLPEPFLAWVRRQYDCHPLLMWENWPSPAPAQTPRYLVLPETPNTRAFWLQVDTTEHLLAESGMVWLVSLRDVTAQVSLHHDTWKFQNAMYHKMRTPLMGIYSGLEYLTRHLAQIPATDLPTVLQQAFQAARRLSEEMEDVFLYMNVPTLARANEGCKVSELGALTTMICHNLGMTPARMLLAATPHDTLAISTRSLELILYELLENSKKFHLTHTPRTIVATLPSADNTHLLLRVIDDGQHLTPEQLAHIWRPYYQAEKSFTGEVWGMGLGLPTVVSLIWAIGGRSHIYNRPDAPGLVVELTIPFAHHLINTETKTL